MITTSHLHSVSALPAALLFSAPADQQSRNGWATRIAELEAQGLRVTHCSEVPHLYNQARQLGESGCSAAVLLDAGHSENCIVCAHLRTMYPALGIVMLLDGDTETMALQAMQSGVDACCPKGASPQLLAALVFRLLWRLDIAASARAAAALRAVWVLAEQAWILTAPDGKRIALTTGERAFLMTLMGAPNQRAAHADLIQAVGQAYSMDSESGQQGRLSVLVSRLRRKCAEQNVVLPLKSVHNWGYMFTGAV